MRKNRILHFTIYNLQICKHHGQPNLVLYILAKIASLLAIHAFVKLLKSPHYHICRRPLVLRLSITRSHVEFYAKSCDFGLGTADSIELAA